MRNIVVLAACVAVSGCLALPERLNGPVSDSDGLLDPDTITIEPFREVQIRGISFQASSPAPVRLRNAPVCEAVSVVLVDGLSLPVTCSAVGSVSLALGSVDPGLHLAAMLRTLARVGARVEVSRSGIIVSAGSDRSESSDTDAAAVDAPALEVLNALPDETLEKVLDALVVSPDRVFRAVGSVPEGDVRSIAAALGFAVDVIEGRGTTYLVGEVDQVALLDAALVDVENTVLSVPVAFDRETAGEFGSRFGVSLLPAGDSTIVVGPASLVRDASRALQSVAPSGQTIRVNFWLVAVDETRASEFSASISSVIFPTTEDFSVQLGAVVSQSWADVISSPSLLASDGKTARFSVGQEVAFSGAIDEQGRQETAFRQIGLDLSVTPKLGASTVSLEVDLVAAEAGDDAAALSRRTYSATVSLLRGQVVEVASLGVQRAGYGRTFGTSSSRQIRSQASDVRVLVSADW